MEIKCMVCGKTADQATLGIIGVNLGLLNVVVTLCDTDYNKIRLDKEVPVEGRKIPVIASDAWIAATKMKRGSNAP